ncbi:MAG: hypothetical protein CMM93_05360 [Rickettsiales bacterium]|mgnify:CR=1 FL=1|nr:hypothetical protein [Rickettsiales bacterium]|tara:strand:- start:2535 stop:3296 length:762 start_codon:yes stop_codon:yes gene_type:complete
MRQGFSLVELSIVLVILGLLTGGILTGQSLIRAAELRSVTTEFQKYMTAARTFQDKYFALPGDMHNAQTFWGSMTNCGAASPSGTGTQTCNGNGNGELESASAASTTGERFAFWQHLANAGLIEGTYTGISGTAGQDNSVLGVNVPSSKLGNAGWYASTWNSTGDSANYVFNYRNFLGFGSKSTSGSSSGKAMTPEETWNIDKKIDDGLPGRGRLIAIYWSTCTEATSNTDYAAPYDLDDTSVECAVRFVNVF